VPLPRTRPISSFHQLPKVDLHRHLEGSLRLATLLELAQHGRIPLPPDGDVLRSHVQVCPGEPVSSEHFLHKFKAVRAVFTAPDIIQRLTREAIADAAADHIIHLELHFTPAAIAEAQAFELADVFEWVLAAGREQARASGISLGLIPSVNRHESPMIAEQVADLALHHRDDGVVALSLAGDEARYGGGPFANAFRKTARAGLGLTIHAGEWDGAASVRQAIEEFGARRIGHGIRILEDPDLVALAREQGVMFEVCLSSNVASGVVPDIATHPLKRMLQQDLLVTLNSDDPTICGTSLSREYDLALAGQQATRDMLWSMLQLSARRSFLPEEGRKVLLEKLNARPPLRNWEAEAATLHTSL